MRRETWFDPRVLISFKHELRNDDMFLTMQFEIEWISTSAFPRSTRASPMNRGRCQRKNTGSCHYDQREKVLVAALVAAVVLNIQIALPSWSSEATSI